MIAENEAQVVEAVRQARERRSTLEIVGGGTRRSAGRPMHCEAVLDVSGLRGIVTYEPEELVLTVKPATTLAEIEAVLGARNQRLGFEPQDWSSMLGSHGISTIGGAVSSDADGPAAIRFGRGRDHLLGIRAVNGFAEAFKAGGKVVKNVTGFDIPKLVCGAWGTLCVLTELTFRVFPRAQRSVVLARRGLTPPEGSARLRQAWSSPIDATGLVYANGTAFVRLEGDGPALAEKRAFLDGFEETDAIEDGFAPGALDIWRLSCRATEAVRIADSIAAPRWYGDWAGTRLWFAAGSDKAQALAAQGAQCLRGNAPPRAGDPRAELERRVKAAFDPLGLFNPGRMA
ncbi:MAG: FAD-binding protein [Alphaproteobacteria bacterium]|nr:FAD-binding protein [Alphaproteobacteria bacterium]MBV9693772.1 FAD-binding protein [Alphaproteobacteria bacterium]